jgi:DNA topoisomerase-1
MGPAQSQRELKSNINRAIDMVAERLGNTRAVCRKYYVHPRVIEAYVRGLIAVTPSSPPGQKRRRRRAQLRRDEVAVLDLLYPERKKNRQRGKAAAGGTSADRA